MTTNAYKCLKLYYKDNTPLTYFCHSCGHLLERPKHVRKVLFLIYFHTLTYIFWG